MHFTPTSASWPNRLRDSSATSRPNGCVEASPPACLSWSRPSTSTPHHNKEPKPFIWTKIARDILQKVTRANSRLSSKQNATLRYKIHGDDTPVPVLCPGRGTTKQGRLWTYVRDDRPAGSADPPAVFFRYSPDRKGERPRAHLASFAGSSPGPTTAGSTPRQSTRYWAPRNSTISAPKATCVTSSSASPIIPSIKSKSCCPGISS
jgi:hypothetical protein